MISIIKFKIYPRIRKKITTQFKIFGKDRGKMCPGPKTTCYFCLNILTYNSFFLLNIVYNFPAFFFTFIMPTSSFNKHLLSMHHEPSTAIGKMNMIISLSSSRLGKNILFLQQNHCLL